MKAQKLLTGLGKINKSSDHEFEEHNFNTVDKNIIRTL
jgi:hypothetical protein